MELCGIGYPTNQSADYNWPDVEKQVKAQKAGVLIAITRGHKPVEAELMVEKGFAAVYQFTNPRTGTRATIWIKDFTQDGEAVTTLPEHIIVPERAPSVIRAITPSFNAASVPRCWVMPGLSTTEQSFNDLVDNYAEMVHTVTGRVASSPTPEAAPLAVTDERPCTATSEIPAVTQ